MEDDDSSSDQPGYISPSYTDYFIAGCRRIRPCNEIDWRKDTEVESDEAKSFVKKAYDDGVPLFTKSALREIQKQLKGDLRAGQKVSIKSIDGVPVEFDVKTGEVVLSGINSEYVAMRPSVYYRSLASILADRDDIDIGYCTIEIQHPVFLRHDFTKDIIDIKPTKDYDSLNKSWESSDICLQLRAALKDIKLPQNLIINEIVAFACGSISGDRKGPSDAYWAARSRERSSYQHPMLRTLQGCHEVQCFAQNPIYTSVDSKVLGEAGITIVADLEGFLQVDDAAVVVSLYPNAPVKQVVADISRPAVIIWDVFTDDGDGLTDPVSSRVEAFMQGFYQAYEFPSDDDNMRNIAVFTRFDI
ncbi:hypothetical protein H112_00046 [Trichophyton rubrum D6]|uniref:SRR1-like domain-containing protein n=3 Tax=Trichophyton TaxID=5550 RepID=F2T1B2_TRIRC|nr:uncharacterized protein TERG_08992 [Trichophyton rubrum CBS 118892]EZF28065.1 hypothetical protein H100_00044 [Trichophyton rubrum MR850]EZF47080.1 hypothetical protein H102_00043 [Trichophyton rubrum CBS 100081]EZF57731.1 hypothetical protein H103_00045 [Trichophyton rubrum CBS 288.86]EZF68342.1 hypothetical protein H104_00043 [Trichophyton rubrum CBS 289.86]EZF79006.1 hypothetical protein H105_00039 [Trichophyton soudanense CBS 452.61]EZF89655.1 hypothetical protein H110_00044 [Trichophy